MSHLSCRFLQLANSLFHFSRAKMNINENLNVFALPGYQTVGTRSGLSFCLEISTSVWIHSVWSRCASAFIFLRFRWWQCTSMALWHKPSLVCVFVASTCPLLPTWRRWRRTAVTKCRKSYAKKKIMTTRWLELERPVETGADIICVSSVTSSASFSPLRFCFKLRRSFLPTCTRRFSESTMAEQ